MLLSASGVKVWKSIFQPSSFFISITNVYGMLASLISPHGKLMHSLSDMVTWFMFSQSVSKEDDLLCDNFIG